MPRVRIRKLSSGYGTTYRGEVVTKHSTKKSASSQAQKLRRQINNGAPI